MGPISASLDILNSWSGVAGQQTPHFHAGADGYATLLIRNWSGGLKVGRITGGNCSIDMAGGQLLLESDNTGGRITVRGQGKFIDESSGSVVDSEYMLNYLTIAGGNWGHDSGSKNTANTSLIPALL